MSTGAVTRVARTPLFTSSDIGGFGPAAKRGRDPGIQHRQQAGHSLTHCQAAVRCRHQNDARPTGALHGAKVKQDIALAEKLAGLARELLADRQPFHQKLGPRLESDLAALGQPVGGQSRSKVRVCSRPTLLGLSPQKISLGRAWAGSLSAWQVSLPRLFPKSGAEDWASAFVRQQTGRAAAQRQGTAATSLPEGLIAPAGIDLAERRDTVRKIAAGRGRELP